MSEFAGGTSLERRCCIKRQRVVSRPEAASRRGRSCCGVEGHALKWTQENLSELRNAQELIRSISRQVATCSRAVIKRGQHPAV